MIVRSIDAIGDWNFGKGKNDYLSGNDAIGQNIRTRLQSFLGDCFFDISAGIDWFNLCGSKNQIGLNLAISSVILNTDGVIGLVELSVNLDNNRKITITYSVTTNYTGVRSSSVVVNNTVNFLLDESGGFLDTESGSRLTT